MITTNTFSIATLVYARLRRVSGRVIDAVYISQNETYARYVIDLALATNDDELRRLALVLENVLPKQLSADSFEINLPEINSQLDNLPSNEPTEEDILREQVSHHYIGSLR